MSIEIILFFVTFLWVVFATISDIKTREVPDWLNYSLFFIGFFLLLIDASVTKKYVHFLTALLFFIIFYGISLVLYYTKQWGGGDAKLLVGMSLTLSRYPEFLHTYFNPRINLPFPIIIFMNIIIVGSLYGIFWLVVLSVKNRKAFMKEVKKIKEKIHLKRINIILLLIAVPCAIVVLSTNDVFLKIFLSLLVVLLVSVVYLYIFIKAIETVSFYKKISPEKLSEGDWVAQDIVYNKKTIYKKSSPGVEKEQIKKIIEIYKKKKINTILVREGIPFVPSFLLSLIISVIWGNIIPF